MSARETPLFFANGAYELFGVLHEPEVPVGRPAFVFCHPFGEEKLWTHRAFVTFARRLAARGHAVLRFDFMGAGDSDGELADASLASCLSDIRCAVDLLRARSGAPAVNLLGIRLGATLASLAAEQIADVRHLVLWTPVVDGGRYMHELLRINLTTQMASFKEIRQDRDSMVTAMRGGATVNVDGYEMGWSFFSSLSEVSLAGAPKTFTGPCLITQVDRQPGRVAPDLQQLAATYQQGVVQFAQEEPFWKEIARFYDEPPNLSATTLAWLDAQA